MKHKEVKLFSIIFILSALFGSFLTFNAFSNQSAQSILDSYLTSGVRSEIAKKTTGEEKVSSNDTTACSQQAKLNLTDSLDLNISRLDKYQQLCNSFAANRLMVFVDMPTTPEQGIEKGKKIASKLAEFKKFGITPVVVAEPSDGDKKISFKDFSNGKFEPALDSYFKTIKEQGIDDSSIGIWVPFPEANVPYWNFDGALPADFATNVNIYVGALKKYFKAKATILLNSQTYSPEDSNWEYGSYDSFVPYVKGIKKGIVDSFGVQGLPWVSPANTKRREQFVAKDFLQTELAVEAAKLLKVKEVWFNTGTFSEKYTTDPIKKSRVSISSRKTMLKDILSEAQLIQNEKFDVWINLFAEDKSYLAESTNWSYLNNDESKIVLKEFITKSQEQEVKLSIFDKDLI
jgi:hypothetical protein